MRLQGQIYKHVVLPCTICGLEARWKCQTCDRPFCGKKCHAIGCVATKPKHGLSRRFGKMHLVGSEDEDWGETEGGDEDEDEGDAGWDESWWISEAEPKRKTTTTTTTTTTVTCTKRKWEGFGVGDIVRLVSTEGIYFLESVDNTFGIGFVHDVFSDKLQEVDRKVVMSIGDSPSDIAVMNEFMERVTEECNDSGFVYYKQDRTRLLRVVGKPWFGIDPTASPKQKRQCTREVKPAGKYGKMSYYTPGARMFVTLKQCFDDNGIPFVGIGDANTNLPTIESVDVKTLVFVNAADASNIIEGSKLLIGIRERRVIKGGDGKAKEGKVKTVKDARGKSLINAYDVTLVNDKVVFVTRKNSEIGVQFQMFVQSTGKYGWAPTDTFDVYTIIEKGVKCIVHFHVVSSLYKLNPEVALYRYEFDAADKTLPLPRDIFARWKKDNYHPTPGTIILCISTEKRKKGDESGEDETIDLDVVAAYVLVDINQLVRIEKDRMRETKMPSEGTIVKLSPPRRQQGCTNDEMIYGRVVYVSRGMSTRTMEPVVVDEYAKIYEENCRPTRMVQWCDGKGYMRETKYMVGDVVVDILSTLSPAELDKSGGFDDPGLGKKYMIPVCCMSTMSDGETATLLSSLLKHAVAKFSAHAGSTIVDIAGFSMLMNEWDIAATNNGVAFCDAASNAFDTIISALIGFIRKLTRKLSDAESNQLNEIHAILRKWMGKLEKTSRIAQSVGNASDALASAIRSIKYTR